MRRAIQRRTKLARTRNRKRRRGRSSGAGWLLPLAATCVVLFGMAGLAYFMFVLQRGPDHDLATNCRINQELRTTVIFLDDTTPFSQTQFLRIKNIISDLTDVEPYEHQVLLTSVRQALQNQMVNLGCLPINPDSADFDVMSQNRTMIEEQRRQFFENRDTWIETTISVGSYEEYLRGWASQFRASGVSVRTTDTEVAITIENSISFDSGSDILSQNGRDIISRIAGELSTSEDFSITVFGHTDGVGESDANLDLSIRRSQSVVSILVENGILGDAVRAEGRGESSPIATNDTEAGRAANRRVEVVLTPTRPLLEALDRSFVLMRRGISSDTDVRFVMFSDMAQASPTYSVYADTPWEQFISSRRGASVSLSSENISMRLYRILRAESISSRRAALIFWRRYLSERNIRVTSDQEI